MCTIGSEPLLCGLHNFFWACLEFRMAAMCSPARFGGSICDHFFLVRFFYCSSWAPTMVHQRRRWTCCKSRATPMYRPPYKSVGEYIRMHSTKFDATVAAFWPKTTWGFGHITSISFRLQPQAATTPTAYCGFHDSSRPLRLRKKIHVLSTKSTSVL